MAICSASVPELTPTQCVAPQNLANSASNSRTSGPTMNWQCASTASRRRRRSVAMRCCCAFRSRNGIGALGMGPLGSGSYFADGAVDIVLEFGNLATQQHQGQLDLAAAAGAADFLDRTCHDGRIGGARTGHQQAGIAGGDRRFLAVEQLLIQFFTRTQAGETDFDVL